MRNTAKASVIVDSLVSVTCDCCKKEYTDQYELQEFLHFDNSCGYASIFGDGLDISLDLCQHCVRKLLGEYLRTQM